MTTQDRFAEQLEQRQCSTKECENPVNSDDKLLTKCSECRERQRRRDHRLEKSVNREIAREAGEVVL